MNGYWRRGLALLVALLRLAGCAPVSGQPGQEPSTAAEILNDRVVPFYDEHGIGLSRMLTDRGTEFCGNQSHEYELYLAVEDIDHSRTMTKSPQTNGILSASIALSWTSSTGLRSARRSIWRSTSCRPISTSG